MAQMKPRSDRAKQAAQTEMHTRRVLTNSGIMTDGSEQESIYSIAKKNMRRLQKNEGTFTTPEELADAIIDYWDWVEKVNSGEGFVVPDVDALCSFLCISRKQLNLWEKNNTNGFREVIEQAKNDISTCLKQLGFQNKIPSIPYVTEMNNVHGYTQKTEHVVTPVDPLGEKKNTKQVMARYMDLLEEPKVPEKVRDAEIIDVEPVEEKNE